MSTPTVSTVVNVCEDTDKTFALDTLLRQANYAATGSEYVKELYIQDAAGNWLPAPTSLVSLIDGQTLSITASALPDWNGSVSTISIVLDVDGHDVVLDLQVIVDPVNDAPEGADRSIELASGSNYVLAEADFGFNDPVEGDAFKSVVISSAPLLGQLLYNGSAVAAGAEISIADIRSGLLVFVPPANASGQVAFGFQVRDDGGTAGCNASDLDGTPNYITFEVPTASLGDRVWYDTNGNGRQDSGEGGVSGVTVTLKGAGRDGVFGTEDDIGATTTTNSSGYYSFNGLAAGQYQVVFGGKSGYAFTRQDVGSNDGVDSDANAAGVSQVVTLAAGQSNMTIDAGLLCKPVVPCAKIVGCDALYEGSYGAFKVQLDFAVKTDTTFWVSASDGSAGRTTTWADNQHIAAGGYCTGYDRYGRYTYFDNQYFDANGRLQKATGPADQSWDYALFDTKDHIVGSSGGFYVTVKAGQTASSNFWVEAWQEQVHVDRRVLSSGYQEAAWETFSLNLSTSSSAVTVCNPCKTVSIGDTSCYQLYSPIVLDLDGNGIQTTALIDSKGSFDLLGTGHAVQSGWISAGDAFLAIDNDGNGRIDDVSELFGGAKGDGFAKLASYDSNHDGVLDANDADFARLMVWQDLNGDHITDAGELRSLAEAGIASLNTAFTDQAVNQLGNILGEASSATRADGSSIDMVDVYFNLALDGTDDAAAAAALPSLQSLLAPADTLLDGALGTAMPASVVQTAVTADDGEALRALVAAMKHADAGSALALA